MQEASVYEPEQVKRLMAHLLPYHPLAKQPKWLSAKSTSETQELDDDDEEGELETVAPGWKAPESYLDAWNLRVKYFVNKWSASTSKASANISSAQLKFNAEVITYVEHLRSAFASTNEAVAAVLPLIPILGPRFTPPSTATYLLRNTVPSTADTELRPVTIIIREYSPSLKYDCPEGVGTGAKLLHRMSHQSWSIPRKMQGLFGMEMVIGETLRCNDCRSRIEGFKRAAKKAKIDGMAPLEDYFSPDAKRYPFTITTSSPAYRNYYLPLDFPMCFPYMTEYNGMSKDLLLFAHAQHDLVNYSRFLRQTNDVQKLIYWNRRKDHALLQASGQNDFVEYHRYDSPNVKWQLDYKLLKAAVEQIDDLEIKEEAGQLCRMFGGNAAFLDWTRKYGIKAKSRMARIREEASAAESGTRDIIPQKDLELFRRGGVLSMLNERGIILTYGLTTEESYKTAESWVIGLATRFKMIGCSLRVLGSDNSKMTAEHLVKYFHDEHEEPVKIMEDVPHVIRRFTGCTELGVAGALYPAMYTELVQCFYISIATKEKPAIYRTSPDQADRLNKWVTKWKAAKVFRQSPKNKTVDIDEVLRTQLLLVEAGRCTHDYEDLATSQSPLEGSYKHLGDTRRGSAAGLLTLINILHFWVLKWNLRTALKDEALSNDFLHSSYGCYALGFVDRIVRMEHKLHGRPVPVLPDVPSGERFGFLDYKEASRMQQLAIEEQASQDDDLSGGLAPILEEVEQDYADNDTEPITSLEMDALITVQPAAVATRSLRRVADDGEILVASYILPATATQPLLFTYSNFASAKQSEMLIPRQKGVRTAKTIVATPITATALSISAQFAYDHLRINPYCHSEVLEGKDFTVMIRLMKSEGWSTFDEEPSVTLRERRHRTFVRAQEEHEHNRSRLKNMVGFEACMKKVECQMCWKAFRGLLTDPSMRQPTFWLDLARSSNSRRQVCAVLNPDLYAFLLSPTDIGRSTTNVVTQPPPQPLPQVVPARRRSRSASTSIQPTENAPTSNLAGFPAPLQQQAQTKRVRRKENVQKKEDRCRRCEQVIVGKHSRLVCLSDGAPRPVGATGKFRTQCPGFPEHLPYPLPPAVFINMPKNQKGFLSKSGFEVTCNTIRNKISMDQHALLTAAETNFCKFVGHASDRFLHETNNAIWFQMSSYIGWAEARANNEATGRAKNSGSEKRKKKSAGSVLRGEAPEKRRRLTDVGDEDTGSE